MTVIALTLETTNRPYTMLALGGAIATTPEMAYIELVVKNFGHI